VSERAGVDGSGGRVRRITRVHAHTPQIRAQARLKVRQRACVKLLASAEFPSRARMTSPNRPSCLALQNRIGHPQDVIRDAIGLQFAGISGRTRRQRGLDRSARSRALDFFVGTRARRVPTFAPALPLKNLGDRTVARALQQAVDRRGAKRNRGLNSVQC